jgi:hypothetical protein
MLEAGALVGTCCLRLELLDPMTNKPIALVDLARPAEL